MGGGHAPEVGWALGDGKEHGDDHAWDGVEANALYELLENEIIPYFYKRDEEGVPHKLDQPDQREHGMSYSSLQCQ